MGPLQRTIQKLKIKSLLPYSLLLLGVCLAYFNCLQNDFVWDDEFLIEKNSFLRSFSHAPKMLVSNSTAGFGGNDNFYRPTQNLYYLLIFQGFGYNKIAFHIGNILIHLLNAWLLFLLFIKIFKDSRVALIGSLLWAVHPTHVEAVSYISGTADPMGVLFMLLCFLAFPIENPWRKRPKLLLSLLFFFLSLVSKESMIVTPALLMLWIFFASKKTRWHWKTHTPSLPFWLLSFGYLLIRKFWLNFDETYEFYKTSNVYTENMVYRIFTHLATLPEYLKILFFPVDLHMERSFPVHVSLTNKPVLLGLLIFSLSLIVSLYQWPKKNEKLLFSWLWYFAAFVPMMGILVPVNSFILEHWLYLPSMMMFACFALAIIKAEKIHPKTPLLLTVILCLTLIYLTHLRNQDWKTPISFYTNILQYSEGSARVHNNLAMAYSEKKQWGKAINHYLKAIELSDTYPQTHYNLARAYIQNNQFERAMQHLNRSLEIRQDFSYARDLKSQLENYLRQNKTSK